MGPAPLVKDMAITHGELRRLLPRLDPGVAGTLAAAPAAAGPAADLELPWRGGRVVLALGPEQAQCLGALTLTRTRVTLAFRGLSEADAAAFVACFDRCFQRGGG